MKKSKSQVTVPEISVVIPLLNERPTLGPLATQLCDVISPITKSFELLFVDDGSTDGSWDEICALKALHPEVRGIRFRKNFRKAAALSAGFDIARGNIIVTIDADLQDDPKSIPLLLAQLQSGDDLVSGWKQDRKDSVLKCLASLFFNNTVRYFTGILLHDINCGLKAYRREVIERLSLYGDLHRFIPVLASQYGFRVSEVKVPHAPRVHGVSHYGGWRLFEGFFDLITVIFITRLLHRPSRAFSYLALMFTLTSSILLCSGLLFATLEIPAWVILFFVITAISIQLFSISLIAEMMAYLLSDRTSGYSILERLD